MGWFVHAEGET
jgi:hypothetical protein